MVGRYFQDAMVLCDNEHLQILAIFTHISMVSQESWHGHNILDHIEVILLREIHLKTFLKKL